MGVPSSYLLWSSSICLPLVLLVHASAQVRRTGTQVSAGLHRREQWREGQGQSLVSRAWNSQREQCQGWQSRIFPGRTWVFDAWPPAPDVWDAEHLPLSHAWHAGVCGAHFALQVEDSGKLSAWLIVWSPPYPKGLALPHVPSLICAFSQILWMSASPGTPFFCRLEAAHSPISEVQASLKLLTRIGGDCLFSVLIRNWLMTMEAANSDTTYYSFSPRPFLVWSCLAPSMLCSWHPALWLQSPLGTDAVKASLSYRRHCYV